MRLAHRIKSIVGSSLTAGLGRRNVVRLGRYLSAAGRLDINNDMSVNGERMVQDVFLRTADAGREQVVFDVGANVGAWTKSLCARRPRTAACIAIHAFEPCAGTFQMLGSALSSLPNNCRCVNIHKALSDRTGTARFIAPSAGAGTNRLAIDGILARDAVEVEVVTLDDYCEQAGVAQIGLLKIDAEGHDLAVMRGATAMLRDRKIDLVQFEYNQLWIETRTYLRDAFSLLQPAGYQIGKITPNGIEFYRRWHFELETWREGNYLACLEEWVPRFRTIPWWKDDGQ